MEERLTKAEKKEQRKQERQEWEQQLDKEKRMSLFKKIGLWGGILVAVVAVIWILVAASSQSNSSSTSNITMPPLTANDLKTGANPSTNSGHKVATLVEYADFQCPACKAYHPLLKQLLVDYNGKLQFVYRYFPLENVHPNALNAAIAAAAANKQGKFWEMHDLLYDKQDEWAPLTDPSSKFIAYAQSLGLNVDQFKKDYADSATEKVVKDSETQALDLNLQGTPTFFINGKLIQNPNSYQEFKQEIDAAIK